MQTSLVDPESANYVGKGDMSLNGLLGNNGASERGEVPKSQSSHILRRRALVLSVLGMARCSAQMTVTYESETPGLQLARHWTPLRQLLDL